MGKIKLTDNMLVEVYKILIETQKRMNNCSKENDPGEYDEILESLIKKINLTLSEIRKQQRELAKRLANPTEYYR